MDFRSQVVSKSYKVSTVTELVNSMEYDSSVCKTDWFSWSYGRPHLSWHFASWFGNDPAAEACCSGAKLTAVFWNCGKTGHSGCDCEQKPSHDANNRKLERPVNEVDGHVQLLNFHENRLIVIGGLLILVPHLLRVPVKLQATIAGPYRFVLIHRIFHCQWKQYFYEVIRNSWSYLLGMGSTWSLWKADPIVYSLLDCGSRHIMSVGSILCHVWNLLDSNRCPELFSDSLQLMIQHVFLRIARGCKMMLMSA